MSKTVEILFILSLLLPAAASAQSASSIVPVKMGAYAPVAGGCDAAAAAFIYIEGKSIGANKTSGKVLSIKQEGETYVLEVLWIEAGSNEADGDRDTVRIEVKDDHSFFFSNTVSKKTLMQWCS